MEKKKYDYIGDFIQGFTRVKLPDKLGFINKNSEEITPIKYDYVGEFENGIACEYTLEEIIALIENLINTQMSTQTI